MSGLGRGATLRAVVVVVAVLAGNLAMAYPPWDLKTLVDKIYQRKAMEMERSIHWGYNLTTVSE